jgi:hypothetical protein
MPILSDRDGSGAVEFAFIAPVVLLMGLLTFDLGMGGYRQMQAQSAAQAGAAYAVVNGYDKAGIAAAVQSATPNATVAASPDPVQFCACSGENGLQNAACGSACRNGQIAGTYVSVYTSARYQTLVGYPGVPSSFPLSAQATVRLQ